MLLFDLTPDRAPLEGHISLPDQGNIRLELQCDKPHTKALVSTIPRIWQLCPDRSTAHFLSTFDNGHGADTLHAKGCAINSRRVSVRHSASFSNTLRDSCRKYRSAHGRRNAIASHTSTTAILFLLFLDSYGLPPLVPNILTFLRHACSVWEYNTTHLQGLTVQSAANTAVCSRSTWAAGTPLNSLLASSMPPLPTGRSAAYSHQNSDRYVRRVAGVRAVHLLLHLL